MFFGTGLAICAIAATAGFARAEEFKVNHEDLVRRYDYKQSLKKPFFLYKDQTDIPYFETRGHTLASEDYLRLTASVAHMSGSVWAKNANPFPAWQIHFSFNVFGRSYVGGEGLALWYVRDRAVEGPVYGSADRWHGLGIFFDTAEPKENRFTPFLHGQINDGTYEMSNREDYLTQSIGGCFRDYRNTPKPVWGRLTYANQTLRLDFDLRQDGYAFTECFTKSGIDLPTGYYFGFSASTGEHNADDHDLLAFETFEVDPKPRDNHGQEEYVIDDETKRIIENVEHMVEESNKLDRESDQEAIGYQEAFSPHMMQTLMENQFKVIEALNLLQDKVGEERIVGAGMHEETKAKMNEAVQPVDSKVNAINGKIDELSRKVEGLSLDIQALFKVMKDFDSKGDLHVREVQRKLEESNAKLDAAHQTLKDTPAPSHWGFSLTFFLLGGILVYVVSVFVRMGRDRASSKRFV